MTVFVVLKTFEAAPEAADRLLEAACLLARQAAASEAGCRRMEVMSDRAAPGHVVILAVFDDEGAFREHCETEHMRRFEDVAEAAATRRSAHELVMREPASGQA